MKIMICYQALFEYRKYAAYRNKAELNARYIEVKKQSYERGRNND